MVISGALLACEGLRELSCRPPRRARRCPKERGKLPDILAVDFAMTGDVVGVAAEPNGLSAERKNP